MGRFRSNTLKITRQIQVQGLEEWIAVRRHPRAHRITLRVSHTQRIAIITIPMKCDFEKAGEFLLANLDWVREQIAKIPTAIPFADGHIFNLRGIPHRILYSKDLRTEAGVVTRTSINGNHEVHVANDTDHAPNLLRAWLILQARGDLEKRVILHTTSLGLKANRISVRDQASRWGSCSSSGNLSFSWRLVMAPPNILDYVVAHEVAHLAEMNHGPKFWNMVSAVCPNFNEAIQWLKVNGIELHRYGTHSRLT
ncbi:MAG: hypothetical protein TECD_01221 [Hyphomicrobiaceae bacterium hypho_1]